MDVTTIVNTLLPTIKNIVAGVMQVSGSGMLGTARELKAVVDYGDEARKKYADHPIIEALVEHLQGNFLENVNIEGVDINNVLSGLPNLSAVVPPQDLNLVKQFIYELAERVASSSGQGLFGTGEKITGTEAQYLEALRAWLSV